MIYLILLGATMPTISMFYGILVSMYVFDSDKHHLPHIHVRYNEVNSGVDRAASG